MLLYGVHTTCGCSGAVNHGYNVRLCIILACSWCVANFGFEKNVTRRSVASRSVASRIRPYDKKILDPESDADNSNNCASRSYSRMPYARQAAPLARPAPPPASRRTIYSCRPPAPLHRYLLRTLGLLPSCLRPAAVVPPPTRRGRAVSCLTARLQQWGAGPCTAAAVWGTLARY
jgi:hypothetical protein